jgi:hypothetical protein
MSCATEEDTMKAIAHLAAVATIAMIGTATAQTNTQTKTHNFTVKQGATVSIGTYYQINTKSCQAGPVPKVVQTSKPTIGKLVIEETKVCRDSAGCGARAGYGDGAGIHRHRSRQGRR